MYLTFMYRLSYQTNSSKIVRFFPPALFTEHKILPMIQLVWFIIYFYHCIVLPCIFMNIQIASKICSKCCTEHICSCLLGLKTRVSLKYKGIKCYLPRHEISKSQSMYIIFTNYCQIAAPTYIPPRERGGSYVLCWDLSLTSQTPHILLNYWAIILQNLLSPTFFCLNIDTSVKLLLSVSLCKNIY